MEIFLIEASAGLFQFLYTILRCRFDLIFNLLNNNKVKSQMNENRKKFETRTPPKVDQIE